ncbi:MAG TPA: hypothetical protein VGL23_11420, partial [Chloroflexota bacterium]
MDAASDIAVTRRPPERGAASLQGQPHLMLRLAENALLVAESLRDNYFRNTAGFVAVLRRAVERDRSAQPADRVLSLTSVADASWADHQGELVTFIDGGIGRLEIASQAPILLRVGSYCVRTGERRLAERERFGYYPVILGDLEGGSKERRDFPDLVRIVAEALGGLVALEHNPDLRVLLFHGPLVYTAGGYSGHSPFTEADVDRFLSHYAADGQLGRALKDEFLQEAYLDVYPRMTSRAGEWVQKRLFEPLAWLAFLYRRMIATARGRTPTPIIAGAVERTQMREFSQKVLLERVFRGLRAKGNGDYFNALFGRADLDSPTALLDRLRYTDNLLMAMLLRPGEVSEPWEIAKYAGLHRLDVSLPGESGTTAVDFGALEPGPLGFPRVRGAYLDVADNCEPIRVETFADLGDDQVGEATRRV